MNKTFSYKVLNEKAYHQKLDIWFAFIFLGIFYASIWLWVEPSSSLLMFLVRMSMPLMMVISLLWISGFCLTLVVLLLTRDLTKKNQLFTTSIDCGLKLLCNVLLDKLTQSTTIRKDIVVSKQLLTGYINIGLGMEMVSSYWADVFVYEKNSLLDYVLNRKQP